MSSTLHGDQPYRWVSREFHERNICAVSKRADEAEQCLILLINIISGDNGEFLKRFGNDWLAATQAIVEVDRKVDR